MALASKLGIKKQEKKKPVWGGPEVDGITQSLLSRFIVCRYRFKLLVIDGLKPIDKFEHRVEYGNMWHVCEEAYAKMPDQEHIWQADLLAYCKELCIRYRNEQEQVDHWYNVCKTQFPYYVEFWKGHPDVKDRKPLLQEEVFKVPYVLTSGRTVYLRGKFDSVDLIGKGKNAAIYLQENKTKGDINEQQIQRQLTFDLQTMLYLIALQLHPSLEEYGGNVGGVRYNVIRRPLSGGKGTIRRHQPSKSNPDGESKEDFYARLGAYIAEEPATYFMRWNVPVAPGDYKKFREQFFDPCLEELCWWWDYVSRTESDSPPPCCHWRTPYGIYNVLAEGGSTDLDEYLATGSEVGLQRITNLFPEL